jgi:hypothetical protein
VKHAQLTFKQVLRPAAYCLTTNNTISFESHIVHLIIGLHTLKYEVMSADLVADPSSTVLSTSNTADEFEAGVAASNTQDLRIRPMPKELRLKPDGSNYPAWRRLAKSTLKQRGLLNLAKRPLALESEEKVECHSHGDKMYENTQDEMLVIRYLTKSCSPQVVDAYLHNIAATPQAIWTAINQAFKLQEKRRGMMALHRLINMTWEQDWSGRDFVRQFNQAAHELRESAAELASNDLLCNLFLSKAVYKQQVWTQAKTISWTADNELKIESLTAELASMDNDSIFQSQKALQATKGPPYNGHNDKQPKVKVKCKHCSKSHKSERCWSKFPDKKPEWVKLRDAERQQRADAKKNGKSPKTSTSKDSSNNYWSKTTILDEHLAVRASVRTPT